MRITLASLLLCAAAGGCGGGDFCSRMQTFSHTNGACTATVQAGAVSAILFGGGEPVQSTCESQFAQCVPADQARLNQYADCLNALPACTPATELSFITQAASCIELYDTGLSTTCPLGLSSSGGTSGTSGTNGSSNTSSDGGTSGTSGTSGA